MQRKAVLFLLVALAVTLFAPAAFAADQPAASAPNWVALASGLGFAIAVAGCAIGMGMATGAACEGFARNPAAAALVRFGLIFGIVFIETLAIYMIAIVFVKVR